MLLGTEQILFIVKIIIFAICIVIFFKIKNKPNTLVYLLVTNIIIIRIIEFISFFDNSISYTINSVPNIIASLNMPTTNNIEPSPCRNPREPISSEDIDAFFGDTPEPRNPRDPIPDEDIDAFFGDYNS